MLTSLLKYKTRGKKLINSSVRLSLKQTQNVACLLTLTKIYQTLEQYKSY